MSDILLAHEPLVRLSVFAGIFAAMATWEVLAPRREQTLARGTRWPGNIGIVVVDTVLVRLLVPTTAVGLAMLADARGWGLVHALQVPMWAGVPLAVVALDLAVYLQHVLFHAVPALWRLHRVHHADLEIDVTTGARFHPIEILLSMGIKLGVVAALGAPAVAVLTTRRATRRISGSAAQLDAVPAADLAAHLSQARVPVLVGLQPMESDPRLRPRP